MAPRVTVLLSSLNHGRFVGQAIRSVLDQTFGDFEMYVIDDRSDDDSWDVIRGFKDPRITAIRNPTRMRGAAGFNRVIREQARGEYIAIHHSDDLWLPTKLERQVELLAERPEVGAVFTQVALIDEQDRPFTDETHWYFRVFEQPNRNRFEWLRRFFLQGNCLCHPSVMARRQTMLDAGLYDRRLGQIIDFDLWVRICLRHEIHILGERLVRFRLLEQGRNQSAPSLATQIRSTNEHPLILEHWLRLRDETELFAVFPELRASALPSSNSLPYLVARRALEVGTPTHRLFGVSTLYRLMSDPATAEELRAKYNFGYPQLVALTGQVDPFRCGALRAARDELEQMRGSWSWRLTAPLRSAGRWWDRARRLIRPGGATRRP
jgi:O-antigen biosynthesis protein